jgi:L-rhamnose isomerase
MFCEKNGVSANETWFEEIEKYEREVLNNRG